jgi:hypothetical protein
MPGKSARAPLINIINIINIIIVIIIIIITIIITVGSKMRASCCYTPLFPLCMAVCVCMLYCVSPALHKRARVSGEYVSFSRERPSKGILTALVAIHAR